MAWLYVPGLEDSNLGCALSSETPTELWVTLSGKPTRRQLSWRGWKKRPWITRLSGTISRPSTAARGAAKWISSLADTRANHSQWPAVDVPNAIRDTCGPTFDGLLKRYAHHGVSARTLQATFDWDTSECGMTFDEWVIELRRDCLRRQRSRQITNGNGCSFWPTPRSSASENRTTKHAPSHGHGHGATLAATAAMWQTPVVPGGGQLCRGGARKGELLLEGQAARFRLPQMTQMGGGPRSKSTRRLNPLFVEWLMGWPIGWTVSAHVETESFRSWRRKHLSALLRLLSHEGEWRPGQKKKE